ncbi:cytochrome c-type biogenesis protein [Brucella gallinifaecis]|uniref:Cytochrome c-type biogenesis protein n=1 Tax=Brucella gallinifaecis TaxID=215590 RepID=A0A502BQV6_9HYPH|nr:cytochrome c-type biogenesis protein [Brucella gallinifaecis]TPF76051.1 cytochrome c-type biogenesis protein CcmH [Brucella gallinifaecis]
MMPGKKIAAFFLILFIAFQGSLAFAVNPDEILPDPQLEKRARQISAELRCMVCQNESINDSNAELARDLRILVRERLTAGDSDKQVVDFIVDRYGEFVLLTPRFNTQTAILWGFPVVVLLLGAIALIIAFRRRSSIKEVQKPLSEHEKAELSRLLDDK